MMPRPLRDRVWEKIVRDPDTGCLEWTGSTRPDGYGQVWGGPAVGRPLLAHRAVYELVIGPIADGLTLDHLCRNRSCVNPAHLEPVTMLENWRRGMSATAQRARQTHCKRGHPLSGNNLKVRGGYRRCRTCEADYNREWAETNRADHLAWRRAWYAANRERVLASQRQARRSKEEAA